MGRKKGSRNKSFEATRSGIIEKISSHIFQSGKMNCSVRELAKIAKISVPTLLHYFRTQECLLKIIFHEFKKGGEPHLERISRRAPANLKISLGEVADSFLEGWYAGVRSIHHLGLIWGIENSMLGKTYINQILEPSLQAVEMRLSLHQSQKIFPKCDLRVAAIEFVSPLLLALLHQDSLSGSECRPMDLKKFIRSHISRFIKAYSL